MACVTLKRSLDFDPIHQGSSCSPRPTKRRRCIPMCMPSQNVPTTSIFQTESSPFLAVTSKVSAEEIEKNVVEHFLRIKRRKGASEKTMEYDGYDSNSPPQSPMSSPSSPISLHLASTISNSSAPVNKEKPMFSFKQVHTMIEQILREREDKLRESYEKVLSNKLAEQYDCFVRFTADQIHQRLSQEERPSYLS